MADEPAPRGRGRRGRVTIADIAEQAGVTAGAVSLAMNGKPGVSDATRTRIMKIAEELNWRPHHAAQTLRGKSAKAIGLVLARPGEIVGEEAFFAKFIAGLQSVMSTHGFSLTLQLAESLAAESAIHRKWIADGRVDGVLILDPRVDDPRIETLLALEHPTIVVGGDVDGPALGSVHTDDGRLMRTVLEHLTALGHERIGYVTGDQSFAHIRRRIDAFAEHNLDAGVWGTTIAGDFVPAQAKRATERLLTAPRRPTAIVYDSEVMAIAGMATLAERGVAVPAQMSIVSWEDSATCQVLHPTVTALDRDAGYLGRLAAAEMLRLLDHSDLAHVPVDAAIVARESSGPPPA